MRARTYRTTRMNYHKFTFLIRGNNRALSIETVAVDREGDPNGFLGIPGTVGRLVVRVVQSDTVTKDPHATTN